MPMFQSQKLIIKKKEELVQKKKESQPSQIKTGGSTFKNNKDIKAWELIKNSGCDKFFVGDAKISEKHCNFLINVGGVNSQNIEDLGEEVRRRVMNNSGVKLEWEIKRVGRKI